METPKTKKEALTTLLVGAAVLVIVVGAILLHHKPWERNSPATTSSPATSSETAAKPEPVRKEVTTLMATARESANDWDVTEATVALGRTLNATETESLAKAVRAEVSSSTAQEYSAVDFNDMLNLLRQNGYGDSEFMEFLASVYQDQSKDLEFRDYALQHSEAWLVARNPENGEPLIAEEATRRGVYDLLFSAAQQHTQSFSGTAASALADLEAKFPEEVDRDQLKALIGDLCINPSAHPHSMITALQLAAEMQMTEHLPQARLLANDAATDPSLRLSAIAAVGMLGDPSDLELLQEAASSSRRYQIAAEAAVQRLKASHNIH